MLSLFSRNEKWILFSFHSFREWKVKWKCIEIEIENEKWNENASRSRSEISKKISRILEKRDSRRLLGGSPNGAYYLRLVEPAWLWESQSRMATPLGMEKYGRIDFALGRWATMGQNAPKLVFTHAKEQVELVRFFLRSLLRPQESLFWRSSSNFRKKY